MAEEPAHLKDEGSGTQVVASGAVAGLISRFCIAPLDVIKIRLQLQVQPLIEASSTAAPRLPLYRGTLGTLRTILQQEGVTALWKGNIPAEILYITYGATQFTLYRATNQLIDAIPGAQHVPDSGKSFVTGAIAGGLSTTATYPLDLLRTRFAAQGTSKVYASLLASIRDITQHEGARGFFQGLNAAIIQIVPYMGLFFASYETLKVPLAGLSLPIGSGDAVAGVLASIASKTAVFPLDTVRKRLQVQGPTRERYAHGDIPLYKGVVATTRTILRREGAKGLYRGLPVGLIKAAPASAITMWTYERTMRFLQWTELA